MTHDMTVENFYIKIGGNNIQINSKVLIRKKVTLNLNFYYPL